MESEATHSVAVVVIGGKELGQAGTSREQVRAHRRVARALIALVQEGYGVVLVHGSDLQIGRELLRSEEASTKTAPRPLDLCLASTQGTVGELLVREVRNLLRREHIESDVVALHTQVLVSREDPAFNVPTKTVGPVYTEWRARELMRSTKWQLTEEAKDRWVRVVPSPTPLDIMGLDAIAHLTAAGMIVLAGGGGGVPLVVDSKGEFTGVEAVVDNGQTATLIAEHLGAELMVFLTETDHVFTSFGRPDQATLEHVTASRLRALQEEGHFPAHGIGRKIESSLQFVESGGSTAIITSTEKLAQALADRGGTRISLTDKLPSSRHQLGLFEHTNHDESEG